MAAPFIEPGVNLPPMKKRVLIFSASAGTGHVKAAEALAKTFAQDPRVEIVEHKDALIYTNKLFRDFYSKLYVQLIRSAPLLLGWVYKQSDEPWKTDQLRLRLDRLSSMPLVKFIRKFRPDITVCTHFMPVGIISHLISRGRAGRASFHRGHGPGYARDVALAGVPPVLRGDRGD